MSTIDPAHELALILDYQAGDLLAGTQLIRMHEGLIHIAVRRYVTERCEIDDLLQVGRMALLRAVAKFDPARGTRLSTYAVHKMHGAAQAYSRRVRHVVNVSEDAHRLKGARPHILWLDSPLSEGGETVGSTLIAPTLGDATAGIDALALLEALPPRERRVMRRLYGPKPETLQAIGDSMGVTRERVRQLKEVALGRLRKAARAAAP